FSRSSRTWNPPKRIEAGTPRTKTEERLRMRKRMIGLKRGQTDMPSATRRFFASTFLQAALPLCTLLAGLLAAASPQCARADDAPRPNIILIMGDDMGYSDIGCYGGEINTPSLDRLAARGVRFTQFYNTARCCPTRACLLTGLYPHQAGIGWMMADRGH